MGGREHLGHRVGNGSRKAREGKDLQVGQVIAHMATALGIEALRSNKAVKRQALGGFALNYEVKAKLRCTLFIGWVLPAAEHGDFDAHRSQRFQAVTIEDMKSLQALAALVVKQAAIGHHPVDIKKHPLKHSGL